MARQRTRSSMPTTTTRTRRSEEQLIADLESRIAGLKERAATKAVKRDPTFRLISKSIKAIDAAASATGDQAVRSALQEARAMLSACMQLKGVIIPAGRSGASVEPAAILAYVTKNPGQRGEHIAAGLGTDTKAIRRPMKQLIEAGQVKTKGERRGMQYWAA